MVKKFLSCLLTLILVISLVFSTGPAVAAPNKVKYRDLPNGEKIPATRSTQYDKDQSGLIYNSLQEPGELTQGNNGSFDSMVKIDAGTRLRDLENDPEYLEKAEKIIFENAKEINFDENAQVESTALNETYFTFNGGEKKFLGYGLEFKPFTLRSIGDNVEIWVANDLSYGYPGKLPDVVTQEQVDLLRDEFDRNIYEKDTEFFGEPDSHNGELSLISSTYYRPETYIPEGFAKKERVIMLIDNVRDESWYGPSRFYVAGFYWGLLEMYIDRNIITIDSNRWDLRMPSSNNPRPDLQYDVFGTIAHEFQHLIHADNDLGEETWINEGMADFSQFLCGYGHNWDHVDSFLKCPENSLVYWDDYEGTEITADYGQAYLMQLYLYDHYGKEFIRDLALDKDNGIESMNKILKEYRTGIDFNELFRRFSIAVAIDSPQPENGIYNFDSIDIKVDYQNAKEIDKDGVPAWGADYKVINANDKTWNIRFSGDYFSSIAPWKVIQDPRGKDNKVLWGNNRDESDANAIIEVDLRDINKATLKFDHFYDIEEGWDFGFVQISEDNGSTWKSLKINGTTSKTDPDADPFIKMNLPGFTGLLNNNNKWKKSTVNLKQYIGKKILINFRYMTDTATTNDGWFIDNIEIPELHYINTCDDLRSFISIDEIKKEYVEYNVVLINEMNEGRNNPVYRVLSINPFNMTEEDELEMKKLYKNGKNYMIVWYAAPEGESDPVAFTYEITGKSTGKKVKR